MFGSVELREFFDELEWEIGKSKIKPRFWLHNYVNTCILFLRCGELGEEWVWGGNSRLKFKIPIKHPSEDDKICCES